MNKTKCYPHNGILFSYEKEWSPPDVYDNTDEPQEHYTEWKKSEAKDCILHDTTYVKCQERQNRRSDQRSRLAVNWHRGAVGVMDVFLVTAVQSCTFTKTHLNSWLSWHIHCTSIKLLKMCSHRNYKLSLIWPFKKLDYIADFIVIYWFGILCETYWINVLCQMLSGVFGNEIYRGDIG